VTAPASRWKLGLFVVASSALGIAGIAFVGANELRRSAHSAYAYFDEALTGLEEGSPVKFRGVTIGVVQRIRVGPDKKHLEVQAALYDDYLRDLGLDVDAMDEHCPLPDNLRAQVVMSWVTSTAFVQVDFFPDPPRGPQILPFPVREQSTLRTVPSTAKSLEDAAREVLRELPQMALATRELVELLRQELQAARLPDVTRQLHALLERAERQLLAIENEGTVAAATAALRSLGDERAPLQTTLREWGQLGKDLRAQVDQLALPATAGDVREAARGVAELSASLQRALVPVQQAMLSIERLAAVLERDPGSLLHGRANSSSILQERSK
jgi:ABC-type transporter Mla subunit MlaD